MQVLIAQWNKGCTAPPWSNVPNGGRCNAEFESPFHSKAALTFHSCRLSLEYGAVSAGNGIPFTSYSE